MRTSAQRSSGRPGAPRSHGFPRGPDSCEPDRVRLFIRQLLRKVGNRRRSTDPAKPASHLTRSGGRPMAAGSARLEWRRPGAVRPARPGGKKGGFPSTRSRRFAMRPGRGRYPLNSAGPDRPCWSTFSNRPVSLPAKSPSVHRKPACGVQCPPPATPFLSPRPRGHPADVLRTRSCHAPTCHHVCRTGRIRPAASAPRRLGPAPARRREGEKACAMASPIDQVASAEVR